ncbi:MAG TPA: elongation factor P [Actinomycetota bacterium]|jgi:elongation factor P|nr:elongation factor P [Actinomycetota bacterium]
MISTNDMRPGQTLDLDGELYSIIKYEHHKPGKGGAMVRTKLKSIKNGAVVERTFRADEKVNLARLDKREMQYLYSDETGYIFMDNETFDQITIEKDFLGDMAGFLKEEQVVVVQLYQGTPIGIDLPPTVELVVTETDPGLQGDRSSAGNKPAIVETGATVMVPLFLQQGETIRVDTRTGAYVTRVK